MIRKYLLNSNDVLTNLGWCSHQILIIHIKCAGKELKPWFLQPQGTEFYQQPE